MLKQPLLDQLQALKLSGMRQALHEQLHMPDSDQLSFTDRLSLLVDRELTERANRRLQYRLQQARLPQSACREDLDYQHPRGLDKTLIQHLLGERWLVEHLNCTPVAWVIPRAMSVCPAYSLSWRWPALTAAIPSCCASTPKRRCWSSMTGVWPRSPARAVVMC